MGNLDRFKKLKESMAELREEVEGLSMTVFKEGMKEIFEKYPLLEKVRWTAYTPYFNDGDECVFSSYHEYAQVIFTDREIYDWDDEDGIHISAYRITNDLTVDQISALKTLEEFLKTFDDDDYRFAFGDHVEVIVTKEGITTEGYSHD